MRNWNTGVAWWSPGHGLLPDYLWGIETSTTATHAEPHSSWASRLPMRNWNSDPSDVIYSGIWQASRLPMRNWNDFPVPMLMASIAAASRLPMRNWNTCRHLPAFDKWRLPDYLWGIETFVLASISGFWVRFQTTYEELKLSGSKTLTTS